MVLRTFAASALLSVMLVGCSKEEEPQCERDSQCASATTACTKGVCRGGVCNADPLPEGTRLTDQSPVKDKFCVKLVCNKTGQAVEAEDGSKVPSEIIPCKKQQCEGTSLKTIAVMDGVSCDLDKGTCRAGVCQSNDAGPVVDTGTPEVGEMDTGSDAGSD
jgi:hypothetical protein